MCHQIRAFIPALPLHLHPHPCLAGHAAATTCSPASGVGCREDGSSAQRSSDIFSLSLVQRAPVMAAVMEHPCMVCTAVSTRDGSRTPTRGLHRGHYNTDRLQGFLQEVSDLQLESHMRHLKQCYSYPMGTQGAILHKQHCGGRRQVCAGKGWHSDTSETSLSLEHRTLRASATTQEGALSTRH